MKIKSLKYSDLEMWMNESFVMYTCNTGRSDKKRLMLAVNHFGVCRVTLGEEIIHESTSLFDAIATYNEYL